MEKEKKDIVTDELNAIKVMPGLQRLESDLIQSSTILPQGQGPPQVHGPLPQFDQVQEPVKFLDHVKLN